MRPNGLAAWNGQFRELLKLSDADLAGAPTFERFIRNQAERGDFGAGAESVEAVVREHLHAPETSYLAERMLPDGRILECRCNPLPDGGLVVMYSDRQRAAPCRLPGEGERRVSSASCWTGRRSRWR